MISFAARSTEGVATMFEDVILFVNEETGQENYRVRYKRTKVGQDNDVDHFSLIVGEGEVSTIKKYIDCFPIIPEKTKRFIK
jgi:hypothetical protein